MCEVQLVEYNDNFLHSKDVMTVVGNLRNLMLEHNDMKNMRKDHSFLLRFLHRTHFNLNGAFNEVYLKSYRKYIVEESDWTALDFSERMKDCLRMNMRFMLNATDNYGKRIYYMRTDTINPSRVTLAELHQLDWIWFESVLDDPKVQTHGLCILMDISGFSWQLLNWLTPTNIRKTVRKLENVIVKDATFHIVRCSSFAKIAINALWPFMPEEIKGKFKFHFNDMRGLLKDISAENLPKEYGGMMEVDFKALNNGLLSQHKEIQYKLEHYRIICSQN